MNIILRGFQPSYHDSKVSTLVLNTCIIQHVLRNNIISKAGDRVHITILLFIVEYFFMINTYFNVENILIWYNKKLTIIRDPNFHRNPNLSLEHLTFYILEVNYNLSYYTEPNHTPFFFHWPFFLHLLWSEEVLFSVCIEGQRRDGTFWRGASYSTRQPQVDLDTYLACLELTIDH